jgi:hypothetical protein
LKTAAEMVATTKDVSRAAASGCETIERCLTTDGEIDGLCGAVFMTQG